MRAMVIDRFGGPDVLRLGDVPDPTPGPGEVRVAVSAIAVARTKDVAARDGRPPFAGAITAFPHVLGTEHAGTVDRVGEGVAPDLVGARVAVSAVLTCRDCRACRRGREEACSNFRLLGVHRAGSYAEFCVVAADNVQRLPSTVSSAEAASLAANGGVAAAQLEAGRVGPGSTVLVLGAAGALGSSVAALAAFRGATVIGIDRLGSDGGRLDGLPLAEAIDGDRADLPEVLARTARRVSDDGVDCVVDNLGISSLWHAYLPSLAWTGTVVMSGAINHDPVPVRMLDLYLRSQSLIGVRTGNRAHRDVLWRDVEAGFRPPSAFVHVTPWERVGEAHAAVESGTARGQIVLDVARHTTRTAT